MPIYGECGGFMYLCKELCDTEGNTFPMTGCFPYATRMLTRLKSLGYREIVLSKDTILGNCAQVLRGHEFHYSEIMSSLNQESQNVETVYSVSARTGMNKAEEGYQTGRTLGSYVHLHFGSQPEAGRYFAGACREYSAGDTSPWCLLNIIRHSGCVWARAAMMPRNIQEDVGWVKDSDFLRSKKRNRNPPWQTCRWNHWTWL